MTKKNGVIEMKIEFENIPILKGKFNCLKEAEDAFKIVREKLK